MKYFLSKYQNQFRKHLHFDSTDVMTPASLAREMVEELFDHLSENPHKLKRMKFLDLACGTGTYLAAVFDHLFYLLVGAIPDNEERARHILERQLYGVDVSRVKLKLAKRFLDHKDRFDLNLICDDSLERDWNMEFDVVVGNPPYLYNKHIDFLQRAYKLSNRFVSFVHPSGWLLDEKGKKNKFENLKDLVKDDLREVTFFNGNVQFGIGSFVPHCITFIDKQNNSSVIYVDDKISGRVDKYEDINSVSKYGNSKVIGSLKSKILDFAEEDNLWKSDALYADQSGCVNKNKRPDNTLKYYVNVSCIRGTGVRSANKGDQMIEDDFYTFIRKNPEVKHIDDNEPKWTQLNFFFESENKAENFLNYIKENFARFALSIYKNGQNLHRGELEAVPNLDFSEKWTREKLTDKFDLTEEEWEFIDYSIPSYYD